MPRNKSLDGRTNRRRLSTNQRNERVAESDAAANVQLETNSIQLPETADSPTQQATAPQPQPMKETQVQPTPRRSQRIATARQHQIPQQNQVALTPQPGNHFLACRCPPPAARFNIGSVNNTENICRYCNALRFKGESLNCCHNGKVDLPPIHPYPPNMNELLTGNNAKSHNFHDNIRNYNSDMAFASFGAQTSLLPGIYSFRIHGQIYHQTGTLHPQPNQSPKYNQLYIIEGDQAVEARMRRKDNQNCRHDIMLLLTIILNRVNPYAAAYKMMKQMEDQQALAAAANNTEPPTIHMVIKRGTDKRRYNEPVHDEVAAVFVGPDGAPPEEQDIVVYPRNKPPQTISHMSSNTDPMTYPIFFPHGDIGWCQGMSHHPQRRTATLNKVTPLQFYAYRLAIRQSFSPLFYGRKLFQQYIVDTYVRVEAHRIKWIRENRKKLRVQKYQGLMDYIHTQAQQTGMNPGTIVILPSSFQGSPRNMQQNYQDAMAMVSKFGRPDLFLTFTCNPTCEDIVKSLLPNQKPQHRPDIVARVFHVHLQELLHDITKKHVLGKTTAHVHVIEFQKRGLPHCHLLIFLAS
jgi:hypothetical protein